MPELDQIFTSNYLKASDLKGREPTVTIRSVKLEEFENDGRKAFKPVVTFAKVGKPLVCNKTNSFMIKSIAGSTNTDDWPGTAVTLYATMVQFGNEMREAIRIRRPTPPTAERPSAGDVSAEAQRPPADAEEAADAFADELNDELPIL